MIPPHDIDAERAVLGSLLLGASVEDEAETYATLDSSSFYRGAHGAIFDASRSLYQEQIEVDEIAVIARLRERGELEKVGGALEVGKLTETIGTNLKHYRRIVHELAMRRRLINAATAAVAKASDLELPVREAVDQVAESVSQIVTAGGQAEPRPMSQLVRAEFRRLREEAEAEVEHMGVQTGFYGVDQKLNGLQPGDLVLLAGRPSMGKTALALAMARNAATKYETPTLVISLEMKDRSLVRRELAAVASVDGVHLRRPKKLTGDEWSRITDAVGKLDTRLLHVVDTPKLTVLDIRAHARLMRARHGLGLLVIDYLGLIRPVQRDRMREREVSEISSSLKALAMELDLPVLCLSQLNRGIESRSAKEKQPRLSDLRESGSLEQDADVVMFVHRAGYYDPKAPQDVAEIIVAKQRNGPIGTIEVGWNDRCVRFYNRELYHDQR